MEYGDHHTQHLRITMLRLLAGQPGYKTNCSLLRDGADAVGISVTRDRIRTELAWLAEQRLVRADTLNERLVVATLTERGLDVAAGRVHVPGVKPPAP